MAIDRRSHLLYSINEGGIDPLSSRTSSNEEPDGDELEVDINSLLKEIEGLKGQVQLLQGQNASLSEKVRVLEASINSLVQKIEQNEGEFKECTENKEKLIMSLKQQIHDLKQDPKECTRGQDIYISQVAFLFEQAICSYVNASSRNAILVTP